MYLLSLPAYHMPSNILMHTFFNYLECIWLLAAGAWYYGLVSACDYRDVQRYERSGWGSFYFHGLVSGKTFSLIP